MSQCLIREKEVIQLIDDIYQTDFLQKKLGFNEEIRLDMDKLIMCGHSMGGITSIATAAKDDRIKAVLTMDPWLWPYKESIQVLKPKKKMPFLHLLSEKQYTDECTKGNDMKMIE